MNSDFIRGQLLAHILWEEIEKIAKAENQEQEMSKMLQEDPDEVSDVDAPTDMENILGTKIVQKETSARGFPVLSQVPGHVFRPDLQGFVPDPNIPGWVTQNQQVAGEATRSAYQKGRTDTLKQNAQKKMNAAAERKVQEMRMAQQGAPPVPQGVAGRPQQQAPQRRAPQQRPPVQRPAMQRPAVAPIQRPTLPASAMQKMVRPNMPVAPNKM